MTTTANIVKDYLQFIHGDYKALTIAEMHNKAHPHFKHFMSNGCVGLEETIVRMSQWNQIFKTKNISFDIIVEEDSLAFVSYRVTAEGQPGGHFPGTEEDVAGKELVARSNTLFFCRRGKVVTQVSRTDSVRPLLHMPHHPRDTAEYTQLPAFVMAETARAQHDKRIAMQFIHTIHRPDVLPEDVNAITSTQFQLDTAGTRLTAADIAEHTHEWAELMPQSALTVHATAAQHHCVGLYYTLSGHTATGAMLDGKAVGNSRYTIHCIALLKINPKTSRVTEAYLRNDELKDILGVEHAPVASKASLSLAHEKMMSRPIAMI